MSKGRRHKRTESQAVHQLENVFKSVDLEGDGTLDYASFQTAMFSLEVNVDDEKMEKLYHELDTDDSGNINYEEFLSFLKKGSLTNMDAAKEILEGAKAAPASSLPSIANTAPASEGLSEQPVPRSSAPKKKLDPKKKSVIQRAVIVIKKAAMKNISREEVVEFLKDKGLITEDINYAYEKAQEQAMSPEERIRYLKTQMASKEKELKDQKMFARHLSDQVSEKNERIKMLTDLVEKAANHMLTLDDRVAKEAKDPPQEVLKEIENCTAKLKDNRSSVPEAQAQILDQDLKKLGTVHLCIKDKRSLLAYLFLQSIESIDASVLAKTNAYLDEFAD